MGQEADMLFRFLARAKITNRNRAMRLSSENDGPLDELDGDFRASGVDQGGLDRLVWVIEQRQADVPIGKIRLEFHPDQRVRRAADESDKIVVACHNAVAFANQEPFEGSVDNAARAGEFAPAIAHLDRDAAKGENNDNRARECRGRCEEA